MQFKPPLGQGAGPTTVKLKLKSTKGGTCTGAAGDGRNVGSLQLSGLGHFTGNECDLVRPTFSTTTTPITMVETVKWKMAKGLLPKKISNSTITVPTLSASTPLDHVQGRAILEVGGSTVTDGSFNGLLGSQQLIADQNYNDIQSACAGKGLKKLTFAVKASKDDFQIGFASATIVP